METFRENCVRAGPGGQSMVIEATSLLATRNGGAIAPSSSRAGRARVIRVCRGTSGAEVLGQARARFRCRKSPPPSSISFRARCGW